MHKDERSKCEDVLDRIASVCVSISYSVWCILSTVHSHIVCLECWEVAAVIEWNVDVGSRLESIEFRPPTVGSDLLIFHFISLIFLCSPLPSLFADATGSMIVIFTSKQCE